jgi:hypothetical protein
MCFVWISEQTAIISLRSINISVFITEAEIVYCAVHNGSSNRTDTVSSLRVKAVCVPALNQPFNIWRSDTRFIYLHCLRNVNLKFQIQKINHNTLSLVVKILISIKLFLANFTLNSGRNASFISSSDLFSCYTIQGPIKELWLNFTLLTFIKMYRKIQLWLK